MNEVIIAVVLAGFGAQLVKLCCLLFKHKTLHWRDLVVTGGMPSSHSAFVVALATSIYLYEGSTTSFAIALVLACIVIRDALGVRRTVGEEGVLLQRILRRLRINKQPHISMGHTPVEVIAGSLVGAIVALLVWLI